MKKHVSTIVMIVIFICGLSLFLYPTVSDLYNDYLNKKLIGEYQELFSDIDEETYKKAKQDAEAYNENLHNADKLQELGLTYENVLNVANNGIMGYIEIPKISVSLVIYHSIDEDLLQNGIGHMEGTALPIGGGSTHAVLAGHTGLPSAKLLTNLDHLKLGDTFTIHVLDETLVYQIDDISVVEPHEVSKINVVSGKDYVTLVTCTPYGVNSHRLLVRGTRVDGNNISGSGGIQVQNDIFNVDMKYLLTGSLIGIVVIYIVIRKVRKQIAKGGEKKWRGKEQ